MGSQTPGAVRVGWVLCPVCPHPLTRVLSSAESGRCLQRLWLSAWSHVLPSLVTECAPSSLALPLVMWLFHFNLIRTPCQEKATQGVLSAVLRELVTRCPLSLMGIWRQDHLSWCPQSIPLKICGF